MFTDNTTVTVTHNEKCEQSYYMENVFFLECNI